MVKPARSKPYDICLIYKTVYERERRRVYFISGRDLKEAKTLLELNDDLDTNLVETHALQYFKTKQEFWSNKDFPCYGLLMQFNENAPKQSKHTSTWHCPACGERAEIQTHKCKPIEAPKALSNLFQIAKPMETNQFLCSSCGKVHSPNYKC